MMLKCLYCFFFCYFRYLNYIIILYQKHNNNNIENKNFRFVNFFFNFYCLKQMHDVHKNVISWTLFSLFCSNLCI